MTLLLWTRKRLLISQQSSENYYWSTLVVHIWHHVMLSLKNTAVSKRVKLNKGRLDTKMKQWEYSHRTAAFLVVSCDQLVLAVVIGIDFGRQPGRMPPIIEKRPCFHQLLSPFSPQYFGLPPNIFHKSTPVVVVFMRHGTKQCAIVNLSWHTVLLMCVRVIFLSVHSSWPGC